jgi:thiamine pyrophosphokinase
MRAIAVLMKKACVVLGGGSDEVPTDGYDLVICADSGYMRLQRGKRPDYLVGDMDSIDPRSLEGAKNAGIRTILYPAAKDLSDGEAALNLALSERADDITIEGTLGDRSDHLLSTFQLLHIVPRGTACRLKLGADMILLVREGEELEIPEPAPIISLIPSCEGVVVSTSGMKYDLRSEILPMGTTRGIHNEPTGGKVGLTVHAGSVFLVLSRA